VSNLNPVEISAEPPQEYRSKETQNAEFNVSAIALSVRHLDWSGQNHNMLGRSHSLLHERKQDKKSGSHKDALKPRNVLSSDFLSPFCASLWLRFMRLCGSVLLRPFVANFAEL
jgi:hypothetical protein